MYIGCIKVYARDPRGPHSLRRSADGDAAATAEEAALQGPSAQCAAAEEVPQARNQRSQKSRSEITQSC